MDYMELAHEFMESMKAFRKARMHKNINDSLHGEAFILQCIYQQGGEILPGEISNEMEVSSARVAAALNSLEKKKLITRNIDVNDRRRILVALTPAGIEFAEQYRQTILRDTAGMLEKLGEHDAQEYVRINKRLAEIAPEFKRD